LGAIIDVTRSYQTKKVLTDRGKDKSGSHQEFREQQPSLRRKGYPQSTTMLRSRRGAVPISPFSAMPGIASTRRAMSVLRAVDTNSKFYLSASAVTRPFQNSKSWRLYDICIPARYFSGLHLLFTYFGLDSKNVGLMLP